jgi:ribonuclease G
MTETKREILISSTNEETRIALSENEKVVEIYVERPDNERQIGDIYLGRVKKVLPGMQAVFVDIGMHSDSFLHFSDYGGTILPFVYDEDKNVQKKHYKRKSDPAKELQPGDEILVQITKEAYANKGCRVTSEVMIPGRFVVLVPNSSMIGVSKKISSYKERKRLKNLAKDALPQGFGLIIRTTCEGKSEEILTHDIKRLLKIWKTFEKKVKTSKAPKLAYSDSGMADSIIRDLFTDDVHKLVVDTRKVYRQIKKYVKDVAPELVKRVEYYGSKTPLFDVFYNIERDLQRSLEKRLWMKNGGYLFIEHTEALTTIDINSGRYIGKGTQEENSFKINLDSAKEIARQIRLRDIGGLVIVDFIDMLQNENKKALHTYFVNEFKSDRAITNIAELSQFGLIEMTRQRLRPSYVHMMTTECPRCKGTGMVASKETVMAKIERFIKRYHAQKQGRRIFLKVHPNMFKYLSENKNKRINRLIWKYWMIVKFIPDESLPEDKYRPYNKKFEEIHL